MSATCYSDEYDDVMISGKWFLVFHHCAGIAAPGAPANKANSLLIAYNPLQPVTKNLSKFCHVLIEPGILSKAVTLAALPSRSTSHVNFPSAQNILHMSSRTSTKAMFLSLLSNLHSSDSFVLKTILLSIAAIICQNVLQYHCFKALPATLMIVM